MVRIVEIESENVTLTRRLKFSDKLENTMSVEFQNIKKSR